MLSINTVTSEVFPDNPLGLYFELRTAGSRSKHAKHWAMMAPTNKELTLVLVQPKTKFHTFIGRAFRDPWGQVATETSLDPRLDID